MRCVCVSAPVPVGGAGSVDGQADYQRPDCSAGWRDTSGACSKTRPLPIGRDPPAPNPPAPNSPRGAGAGGGYAKPWSGEIVSECLLHGILKSFGSTRPRLRSFGLRMLVRSDPLLVRSAAVAPRSCAGAAASRRTGPALTHRTASDLEPLSARDPQVPGPGHLQEGSVNADLNPLPGHGRADRHGA